MCSQLRSQAAAAKTWADLQDLPLILPKLESLSIACEIPRVTAWQFAVEIARLLMLSLFS